jgi:hypothetical protein
MRMHPTRISYLVLVLLIGVAISGFGHVRVSPRESAAGRDTTLHDVRAYGAANADGAD